MNEYFDKIWEESTVILSDGKPYRLKVVDDLLKHFVAAYITSDCHKVNFGNCSGWQLMEYGTDDHFNHCVDFVNDQRTLAYHAHEQSSMGYIPKVRDFE